MTQSAHPLFRAISGAARREREADEAQSHLLQLPEHVKQKAQRRAFDWYPTGQPEAVRGLLFRDNDLIRACGAVWEPACGDGAMVREIRRAGIPCVASDLVDRACEDSTVADFYSFERAGARAIITNPPYCEINARDGRGKWLRHTLDMPGWDYLALLLSWDWPAARTNGLGAMLDRHPFSYCYLARYKIDFTGEGSPPQRNAWFVWIRDWDQVPMQMRFLNREDGDNLRQGSFDLS